VMFVLLGLLVSPQRLVVSIFPAVIVALVLMLVARPLAVFLCLAPFRFNWREKIFIAWTGLRGAVAIFLASIPMLVGLSKAYLYFDVAFVVVIISLLLQGATAPCRVAASRSRPATGRTGSARPARAAIGRLFRAVQEPVFPARPCSIVVKADAGDP
jgi:NhaP-type Na+/H+ and K+/H+ antiporter